MSFRSGTRVAGRFTIERRAGAGGMGTVYLARDSQTNQPVALKVLIGDSGGDGDSGAGTARTHEPVDLGRFEREAAVLADLAHPGIVRYVDHGFDEHGAPYLAMEWVEGKTLTARLSPAFGDQPQPPITRDETLALVKSIAEALGAAHERGIIHRDIKPSNIVLEDGDVARPRLLDFGIARLLLEDREREQRLTQTGAVIGTPGYMAPEQAAGGRKHVIDERVDVYALGCLFFRCLAGRTPFVGAQPVALLAQTILEDAPPVRDFAPDVPPRVDALIARMLARDPKRRPIDGRAVVQEIDALLLDAKAEAGAAHDDNDTETGPVSFYGGDNHEHSAITKTEQRFVTAVLGTSALSTTTGSLEAIAQAHEGRFETLADGSFLVLFSATSAGAGSSGGPTDLAVRACQCALALASSASSGALAIVSGHMAMRGTALLHAMLGELFDRAAARRQTAAGITIDAATSSLAGERFIVTEDGQLLSAPTTTATPPRMLLGKPSPCVGRDRELGFLEGLYNESTSESAARVAVVVAPPGAGKSRLRRELLRRLQEQKHQQAPLVLLALGDPIGGNAPLTMLGESLRHAQPEEEALASWLGRRGVDADSTRLLLAMAAHGGDRSGGRAAILRAWTKWLDAELHHQPVVIVLEDLHWGDQATVDFLDASLRAFASRPLFVLALARPEVKMVFTDLWSKREPQELRLGPLTRAASMSLVRAVVGPTADEARVAMIVDRAEGNAFFLEELIRSVGSPSLPDTVLAVVQSRLDALGSDLTRVLRAASVFGDHFWREGVAAIVGVRPDSRRLAAWLSDLMDRELIEQKPETTIANTEELAFRHNIVREAAYALLTPDDLRLAHRLAAEWLVSFADQRVAAAALVTHFDRAGDAARAIQWSIIDAQRALDALDISAIARAEHALQLGATGEERGCLLKIQAQMYEQLNDPLTLPTALEAVKHLPVASAPWYAASFVRVLHAGRTRDKDFDATLVEVAGTKPRAGDDEAEVEYVVMLGEAIVIAGRQDYHQAIPFLVAQISPYLDLERAKTMPPRAAGRIESVLAMRYTLEGRLEDALLAAQRAVAYRRAAGELTLISELTVVQMMAFLGDLADAAVTLDRIVVDADRVDSRVQKNIARYAKVLAASALGNFEEAYERGCQLKTAPDRFEEVSFLVRLDLLIVEAAFRSGRLEEGKAILDALPAEAAEAAPYAARVDLSRAQALLLEGHSAQALDMVEQALPRVESSPFDRDETALALLHARALLAVGDMERSRTVLTRALNELRASEKMIADPRFKRTFMENIATHRELLSVAKELGVE